MAGKQLGPDEIVRLQVGSASPRRADVRVPRAATGLTSRELELLRHLPDGLTNQQIADTLGISHRTVMNHVANILGKLGVESRTAAASFAIRQELV